MGEEFITEGMLDMFLFESGQLVENIENLALDHKDDDSFDDDAINEIFRAMHTIKGSSGIMMYTNITTVSHTLEDVFYYIRESHPSGVPHEELVEYILDVTDFIGGELEKIKEGSEPDGDPEDLIARIKKFLKKIKKTIKAGGNELPPEKAYVPPKQFYIAPVASEESRFYKIFMTFDKGTAMSNVRAYQAVYALKEIAEDILYAPDDILTNEKSGDIILEYGFKMALQTKAEDKEVMSLIGNSSGIANIEIDQCEPEEFLNYCSDIPIIVNLDEEEQEEKPAEPEENKEPEKVIERLNKQADESMAKRAAKKFKDDKKQEAQSFISVNVKKMDELMDYIGELVIAEAVVLQNPDLRVPGLDLTNFHKAAAQLSKITTELQETIMSMRMMPLKNTFQKMNRIVYDVSRKLGKDIELEVIGEDTEVDKNIIEHISDPLMHLIRNAVDHGIEPNDEREAAGKYERGKVTLEAKNEGGKVWIIVKDNGKGLNRYEILAKAKENGLLGNKNEKELSDKEVFAFITYPGFSTKKQVTEYSGRGVGMDVVMKNIQDIGGSLEIESLQGVGSTMILKIPLTLAIIDGITFEVGETSFVIATNSVKEFICIKKEQMIVEPDGNEYVMIRGECYPVLRLSHFYHIENAVEEIEDGVMLIIEHEEHQICLFVDKLVGEQEIVVKPMPSYMKKVKGISGCTQLGDGSISLILDAGSVMLE